MKIIYEIYVKFTIILWNFDIQKYIILVFIWVKYRHLKIQIKLTITSQIPIFRLYIKFV